MAQGGAGFLQSTLKTIEGKFRGVVNGIDYDSWDPARDPFIAAPYSAAQRANKELCKRFVRRGFGMREPAPAPGALRAEEVPLVICITRLVPQKGAPGPSSPPMLPLHLASLKDIPFPRARSCS